MEEKVLLIEPNGRVHIYMTRDNETAEVVLDTDFSVYFFGRPEPNEVARRFWEAIAVANPLAGRRAER